MTTSPTAVSNRATSVPSAIQARAGTQSAAIAMLGAGTARLAQSGESFAETLNDATKESPTSGLFSDTAAPAPAAASAKQPAARTRTGRGPNDSSGQPERETVAETTKPTDPGQWELHPDSGPSPSRISASSDTPLKIPSVDAIEAGNSPASVASSPVIAAQTSPATSTANSESASSAANVQDAEKTSGNVKQARGPTDPLRLIQPPKEQASDSPEPGMAPSSGQNQQQATATSSGQAGAIAGGSPQPNVKQSTQPTSSGAIASVESAGVATAAVKFADSGAAPAGSAQSASASSVSGVGGAKATTSPTDVLGGQRVAAGRPRETPVSVRFQSRQSNGTAPEMSQTEMDSVAKSVSSGLTSALRWNSPNVTLWLNPETLGKVKIQLTFDQGAISAKFEATNQATANLLKENTDALKSALAARGLRPEAIEVTTIPDWSKQNGSSASDSGTSRDSSSQSGGSPFGNQSGGQPNGQSPNNGDQNLHSQALNTAQSGAGSPPRQIAQVDTNDLAAASPRLLTMHARLELDAVA